MEPQLKTYYGQLAKWQKINGIFFVVGVVVLLLVGLAFLIFGSKMGAELEEELSGGIGLQALGIVYILMGVLYYFPAKYLLKASKKTKEWLASDDELDLTEGVLNTKSYFKFLGVLCIISLCLLAIVIIGIIIAALVGVFA
ncbi:MAG: hypothetical protein IKV62_04375 [Bacteroidales bacterium]|nr:hypothetical protein [Bacteroidales bacterium]